MSEAKRLLSDLESRIREAINNAADGLNDATRWDQSDEADSDGKTPMDKLVRRISETMNEFSYTTGKPITASVPSVSEMLGASECPKRLRQCARHDWRYVGVVPYGTATMDAWCQCRMENLWEMRDREMVPAPNVDIVSLVLYTFIVNRERVCILFGQCDTCGAVYYARQAVGGCGACWPAQTTTDEMGVWDE